MDFSADVARLSPTCWRVMGGNPGRFTLQGTNTYLLGTGRGRILIDTGEGKASWLAALKTTLDAEGATVESVLITHWHPDHQGGISQLLSICPGAKIYKNEPKDGTQLNIIEGQIFSVPGATLRAAHTPGHTTDHMVFVLDGEDAMFTGDNVLGQGTAVFEDLGIYIRSLERMQTLFTGRAYPGHGPVVANGPAKIREYIEHRKLREDQVVMTLRSTRQQAEKRPGAAKVDEDAWTAMELVKVIYKDVPNDLHVAACGSVNQILAKLAGEGRASATDGRWRLIKGPVL